MGDICSHFGRDYCFHLPALLTVSWCDTTFCCYNVEKMNLLKTVIKSPRYLALLASLEKEKVVCGGDEENVQKFVRMAMYPGKD